MVTHKFRTLFKLRFFLVFNFFMLVFAFSNIIISTVFQKKSDKNETFFFIEQHYYW